MKSDTCREKLKGNREVYRRSDGRQELRSCIRSRISQAANGVHLAVALLGLTFVSLEWIMLHRSEPSAIDLHVVLSVYQLSEPSSIVLKLLKPKKMFLRQ